MKATAEETHSSDARMEGRNIVNAKEMQDNDSMEGSNSNHCQPRSTHEYIKEEAKKFESDDQEFE